ncbi:MAG: DUF1850 domain-containing protein [Spirochaetaceae bacterium]
MAVAAAAVALGLWIVPPELGVEVINEDGESVARFHGVRSFVLRHTHSVMKTPVEDYYEVASRTHLVQTQTRYRSLGAGLPSSGIGEFRREDGWFVRDSIGGRLERITVRVGRVSKQVLMIDGKEIPLRDLDTAGKALTIRPAIILFSMLWV